MGKAADGAAWMAEQLNSEGNVEDSAAPFTSNSNGWVRVYTAWPLALEEGSYQSGSGDDRLSDQVIKKDDKRFRRTLSLLWGVNESHGRNTHYVKDGNANGQGLGRRIR